MDATHPQGHQGGGGGHEPFEVNMRPLFRFLAAMLVIAVLVHFAMGWMMSYYAGLETPAAKLPSPEPPSVRMNVPAPPLQPSPHADLVVMQREDRDALEGYGWVDRKAGIARIPIEEAIDLLVKKGQPTRKSAGKGQGKAEPKSGEAK